MKYLLLLAVIGVGYYLYTNKAEQRFEITNSETLFRKLETSSVNSTEIIKGASAFALNICDDTEYQHASGHTPLSCRDRFNSFKEMCVERIFANKDKFYVDPAVVRPLFRRFINCVGT